MKKNTRQHKRRIGFFGILLRGAVIAVPAAALIVWATYDHISRKIHTGAMAAIEEDIYVNHIPELVPDDVDYENVYVQLQEEMPEELISTADEFVRLKEVTIVYYILKDGKELKREGQFGISPKDYAAMKKTALSEENRDSDFALMKKLFPKEYFNVAELVEENGYKECVRDFGQGYPVVLREFPFQVFINL